MSKKKKPYVLDLSLSEKENENLVSLFQLWILRVLVPLGGQKEFVQQNLFKEDSVAELFSFEDHADETFQKDYKNKLSNLFKNSDQKSGSISDELQKNLDLLKKAIKLDKADLKILSFIILLKSYSVLEEACDFLGHLSSNQLSSVLSVILDIPISVVKDKLKGSGLLLKTGLLSIDHSSSTNLDRKLDLISDTFANKMLSYIENIEDLFSDIITLSAKPQLTLFDYSHLEKEVEASTAYLKNSAKINQKGVNFLIYGRPGTGKTELVRLLSKLNNGSDLYEISTINDEEEPLSSKDRLRAYRLAQVLFADENRVILFDEIEDIFNDGGFFDQSTAQKHKGWINNALETNTTPTFWVTNNHYCMDNAFLRRFDMVFEIPVPKRSKRIEIIQNLTTLPLRKSTIEKIAESTELTPAVIARSIKVASCLKKDNEELNYDKQVVDLTNNTLIAQGHKKLPKTQSNKLPSYYSSDYVNTSADITGLKRGLECCDSARICIYGPPGTGKTAYVNWLSKQLDKPIISKLVSELQSPWVGVAEKNIAEAFEEAESENAILLFDEVDSFLQDRTHAKQSWQISQVNELLKQMEEYEGIFFAVTNLVDTLDKAALRRFDMKLNFNYLKPNQAKDLFLNLCASLEIETPNETTLQRLSHLDILTPGDINALARQHKFSSFKTPNEVIDELIISCDLKQGFKNKSIGFH